MISPRVAVNKDRIGGIIIIERDFLLSFAAAIVVGFRYNGSPNHSASVL